MVGDNPNGSPVVLGVFSKFVLNFHMLSVYFVFSTWSQLAPNWIVIFIEVFIT